MKTPHPLFFMRYFYIILIGLFLLSGTACSDYFELGTEVAQDPVAEAKADFHKHWVCGIFPKILTAPVEKLKQNYSKID